MEVSFTVPTDMACALLAVLAVAYVMASYPVMGWLVGKWAKGASQRSVDCSSDDRDTIYYFLGISFLLAPASLAIFFAGWLVWQIVFQFPRRLARWLGGVKDEKEGGVV